MAPSHPIRSISTLIIISTNRPAVQIQDPRSADSQMPHLLAQLSHQIQIQMQTQVLVHVHALVHVGVHAFLFRINSYVSLSVVSVSQAGSGLWSLVSGLWDLGCGAVYLAAIVAGSQLAMLLVICYETTERVWAGVGGSPMLCRCCVAFQLPASCHVRNFLTRVTLPAFAFNFKRLSVIEGSGGR